LPNGYNCATPLLLRNKDDETRYQFVGVCLKLWKLYGQRNDNKASKT